MSTYERMSFVVGETFASYAELETKKKRNKRRNAVQRAHRVLKTLEAARKRVPKRVEGANEDLRYHNLVLIQL